MRRAVFLDRDGVLNRAVVQNGKPYPPSDPSGLELLPGVLTACVALRQAGFLAIVVTNQPDVARGLQQRETVEAMHRVLQARLPVDDIYACYHDDSDGCGCRKPQPGLLVQAARKWHIDLSKSFMVGDRWKDIDAGFRAGCMTIFVDHGYAEEKPRSADRWVTSLAEAAAWILEQKAKPVKE